MPTKLASLLTVSLLLLSMRTFATTPEGSAMEEGDKLDDASRTEVLGKLKEALEAQNLPSAWIDDLVEDPPDIHATSDVGDNFAKYQPAWQGPFGNGLAGDTIHVKPGLDPTHLSSSDIATLTHESWHAWFDFVPTYPFTDVSRFSDGQEEAIGGFIDTLVAGDWLSNALGQAQSEGTSRGASHRDIADAIKALEKTWDGSFFSNGFKNQSDVNRWVLMTQMNPEYEDLEAFLSAGDQKKLADRREERARRSETDESSEPEPAEDASAVATGPAAEPKPETEPDPVREPEPEPEPARNPYTPENCPPCQHLADDLATLQNEITGKRAKLQGLQTDRQTVDVDIKKTSNRIAGLENVLNRSAGTGGSSYDPGSGITIEAWDQGDGTVKVTTRDRNGNVLSERVRDGSRHKARLRKAIERERQRRARLEADKAKLDTQIASARADIAATEARVSKVEKELADCIKKLCSGNATDNAVGMGSGALIDPTSSPELINASAPALASAGRDPSVQLMIVEFTTIRLGSTAPPATEVRVARGRDHDRPESPTSFRQPFRPHLAPARRSPATPAPAGVSLFIESLGTSTGEAFTLRVFSPDGTLGALSGDGIVVEPVETKARKKIQKELGNLAGQNELTQKVTGYCLELLREPPDAGAFFRVANREIQERFAPVRNILKQSRELFESGALHPDSDPAQYFHSIRQWAVWSSEEGLDARGFGKAFVERTKKNFEAAGQDWTGEIETAVQGLVPNRWKDIEHILGASDVP